MNLHKNSLFMGETIYVCEIRVKYTFIFIHLKRFWLIWKQVLQQRSFFINLLRFPSLRAQMFKILQLLKFDGGKNDIP